MAKQSKKEVQRTCQECGKKFMGNPLARYCYACRQEIIKEKEALQAFHARQPAKGAGRGPVRLIPKNQSGLSRICKQYLTFTRVAIINVIILFLIHGIAMYITSSSTASLALIAKAEEFQSSSVAAVIMLIWGCALRGFYWWREPKGHIEWKENYWKQLLTWLVCVVFTVGFAVFLLVRPAPGV